jgi:hypothetical protein
MKILAVLVFWLVASLGKVEEPGTAQKAYRAEIEYCQIAVPDEFRAEFRKNIFIYELTIGREGRVTRVRHLRGPRNLEAAVSICVSTWRFESRKFDRKFELLAEWDHSRGWTKLAVVGDEYHFSIALPDPSFTRN